MEYLLYLAIALALILLVVLLLSLKKQEGASYVRDKMESLSREMGESRRELLSMLEQYRTSMERTRSDAQTNTEMYRASLSSLSASVASSLEKIRTENDLKLEQIRQSVDVRLKTSLSDSFSLVTSQLNEVHRGLGEMQSLASGVGDLRRLMGNIKSRGIMGEVQARNILEDIMTPDQYEVNCVCRKGSNDRVEFAVKLPGRGEGKILFPIDCKFPREDYERLLDARDAADKARVEEETKALQRRILEEARDISRKYIAPPDTTDFAILFLPFEGLYAQVLSIPGLCDQVRHLFRVVIAGPSTLAAILNSFQMGFRTLAIEKRSAEVRTLLSVVKTEFQSFDEALERMQKSLLSASSSLENVEKRTRVMGRKLRDVELLDDGGGGRETEERATDE